MGQTGDQGRGEEEEGSKLVCVWGKPFICLILSAFKFIPTAAPVVMCCPEENILLACILALRK